MSTVLTRFEIQLPLYGDGTPQAAAVAQFLVNIQTLCDTLQYSATRVTTAGVYQQCDLLYGMITTAQQQTALGYLNTLNAALPAPVLCSVWQITTEP